MVAGVSLNKKPPVREALKNIVVIIKNPNP
jgi:hypothetical protein